MEKPVLVILAAGMGSRYGGLKQIDTVGNNGESIIDFSIYDAKEAGFETVVLIIRSEHEKAFEEALGSKIRKHINVIYAYQNMNDLPNGFEYPQGREKPWGTTHALLSCRDILTGPFMIINADDYYGKNSFKVMYDYLSNQIKDNEYAMVGYILENTVTHSGMVTRAICENKDGYLSKIVERGKIGYIDGVLMVEVDGQMVEIDPKSQVSMNYWGFTPAVFPYFQFVFRRFLNKELAGNPLKCEHVLPTAVGEGLMENQFKVRMLASPDRWFGVTYREDKPMVVETLAKMKSEGLYPFDLWK
jgi:NDP-sugar pyrophosphorylase family protein